ncbi:DnaB-like helicase N-terminal domain-containing protein [Streptomyces himalayensis]|uniref:DNA helicase DnaB-like N-terminal domain-containing protein n=1 Tax=Streptomyces himalayensis subsp. himalayensis TaxID=2756131 RepID=A0A7W0DSU6_9ACTN|nr:DnaB-like helicase N-terminal domain-containing protein [Streptomyces himalayensis]MBA2950620.1 hypothetical protein [Streptomyces himalayensis subsp. himalayensis]
MPTTLAEADALAGAVEDIAARFPPHSGPRQRTPAPTPTAAPYNAEEAVDEECLLLATATAHPADVEQMRWLTADDFTQPLHAGLWQCLTDLTRRRTPVDPVTVLWEAQQRSLLTSSIEPPELPDLLRRPETYRLRHRMISRRVLPSLGLREGAFPADAGCGLRSTPGCGDRSAAGARSPRGLVASGTRRGLEVWDVDVTDHADARALAAGVRRQPAVATGPPAGRLLGSATRSRSWMTRSASTYTAERAAARTPLGSLLIVLRAVSRQADGEAARDLVVVQVPVLALAGTPYGGRTGATACRAARRDALALRLDIRPRKSG